MRLPDGPLPDENALALADASGAALEDLLAAARARRDRRWGRTITYSPKVFLPVTNLCRNRCEYCSFRRSPGDVGAKTMSPDEIVGVLRQGRDAGCTEALLCLGDKPEGAFGVYRATLARWGQEDTVQYLAWTAERALGEGLLPHTNAGVLSRDDMARLKESNVSLGLMLETASARLCTPGMAHHRAPDKRPEVRLRMIAEAGELRIPFTTGILVGIGETRRERVEALLAIRRLHRQHGHVQEVIVQPFRAHPATRMAAAPEPSRDEMDHAIALARLVLDDEVTVQSPPNLSTDDDRMRLHAGLNDLGGISPVTPDFINPNHPWPHVERLSRAFAREGFQLSPRLAVHDSWARSDAFVPPALRAPIADARGRLRSAAPC